MTGLMINFLSSVLCIYGDVKKSCLKNKINRFITCKLNILLMRTNNSHTNIDLDNIFLRIDKRFNDHAFFDA